LKYLNLACGLLYIDSDIWENCDFSPEKKNISKVNLLKRFPYNNNEFNVVYSSHFIEHIPIDYVFGFLNECFRVLKPNGILRLVLPDFENIANEYVQNIKLGNLRQSEFNIVEMIDQCVRTKPGGVLEDWYQIALGDSQLKQYVEIRTGKNFNATEKVSPKLSKRLKNITPGKLQKYLVHKLVFLAVNFFPNWFKTLHVSRTNTGERHHWMYDFNSISNLLKKVGFKEVSKLSAYESSDSTFPLYPLDLNESNVPRKGLESMYIESRKP
jgi:predicted SAM-dependent methyltransferase